MESGHRESNAQRDSSNNIADKILRVDQEVIGCYIVRVPDGAVLADMVKSEYRSTVKPFGATGAGMASKWGLMGLSASKRMDGERGKTKYLIAARERFVTLLFLSPHDDSMEIGIMLTPDVEPSKIYEKVMKLL